MPIIEEILEISGTPSLSIAVIYDGNLLHAQHFGFRDVGEKLAPDDNTRYNINSMTKAIFASLVALEVSDGRLEWSSRVKDYLPNFASRVSIIQDECTISDLLSHGTGLPDRNVAWFGSHNSHLLERDQALPTFATLLPIGGFRRSFVYNNWGYEIVGQILEKVTGKSLGNLLADRIFKPLNMTRTSTVWDDDDGNNARSYAVLDDLSVTEVGRPQMIDGKLMQAAGGVKSTLHDLVILYQEMLAAMSATLSEGLNTRPENIFQQCLDIFKHQRTLPDFSIREQSYGFGWFRAQLPGQLNRLAGNTQPIIGKGVPSQLVLYHPGGMSGSSTAVYLLPEIQSAVIALQNSTGPIDAADHVAELLVERLLGVPDPVDICNLVRTQTLGAFACMGKVKEQLEGTRESGTSPKPLTKYVRRYRNEIHNWVITIRLENGSLTIAWQNLELEKFPLSHYHHNTFTWWMSWNEVMKSGRFPNLSLPYWLIEFCFDGGDQVTELRWAWDASLPEHKESFKLY